MNKKVNGAAFRDMILFAAVKLEENRQVINDLNVFPVPDGDTGTNMSLTIGAAALALSNSGQESVGKAAELVASALLRSARGNSGVILSLLFRGFSRSVRERDEIDGIELAAALAEGVEAAYKAVMKPAEGTILTVSRLASDAARESESDDVETVLETAVEAARTALADTINQNPVLKKAGVIDAGGKGYLVILEGMLSAFRGEPVPELVKPALADKADFAAFTAEDIKFCYCTEFIVSRNTKKSPSRLRSFLEQRGDSIVVVDDDEIIKVHVHSNCPGEILTEALSYGALLSVKVENMREQHSETLVEQEAEKRFIAAPEKAYGVAAVCAGEGLEEIFRSLGADRIITGGQTMNPSTEDILKAIDSIPAETVYVLPNNKNIIMAAEQCIGLSEKKVVVLPTKTLPQGVSALLAMDSSMEEAECTRAMLEAIGKVGTVSVTYAARDSVFGGESIAAGDFLALIEGRLLAADPDFELVLEKTIEALKDRTPEFVTVYYGEDLHESEAELTRKKLEEAMPEAEVTLVYGGQPVYYYIISAE